MALLARRFDRLESLAEEIQDTTGQKAIAIRCDVTDEQQVQNAVKTVVDAFGKIDILLNNAGTVSHGSVEELSREDWMAVINTNLTGVYLMCKYVVPYMRAQKYGKIVNVSSVNAIIGNTAKTAIQKDAAEGARHVYNATKAGVRGLTMAMAGSYMSENITVNAIAPGFFRTEMTEETFRDENFVNSFLTHCPATRPGKLEELMGTIIYLSADASSYVTSQYILVDGGLSIV